MKMKECENCRHAFISKGETVVKNKDGSTFIMRGRNNLFCTLSMNKDASLKISFKGKEMECNGFEPIKISLN